MSCDDTSPTAPLPEPGKVQDQLVRLDDRLGELRRHL